MTTKRKKPFTCKNCGKKIKYYEELAGFFVEECRGEPICVKCFYIQKEETMTENKKNPVDYEKEARKLVEGSQTNAPLSAMFEPEQIKVIAQKLKSLVQAEREACAKIADETCECSGEYVERECGFVCNCCAPAIRHREDV